MIVRPEKVETALIESIAEIGVAWDGLRERKDAYTADGLRTEWERVTLEPRARIEKARDTLDMYEEALSLIAGAERRRLLPAAPAAGYDMTTELAAARVVGRAGKWEHSRLVAALEPLAGTPAASLIVEELQARELITPETVESVLMGNDRYAAVAKFHHTLLTGLNASLRVTLREAERATRVESWSAPGGFQMSVGRVALSVIHGPVAVNTVTGELEAPGEGLPPVEKITR